MKQNNRYQEAFELLKKGVLYQKRGKIKEAIKKFKASIEILPTAEAHTYLGWAFSLQGRYDRAIQECYRAIHLDEDYGNPYNDLGSYLIVYKKYDESLQWFEKAIKAPRYEERHFPYFNLGRVYEFKGDWYKAIDHYREAFRIQPSFQDAIDAYFKLIGMVN